MYIFKREQIKQICEAKLHFKNHQMVHSYTENTTTTITIVLSLGFMSSIKIGT